MKTCDKYIKKSAIALITAVAFLLVSCGHNPRTPEEYFVDMAKAPVCRKHGLDFASRSLTCIVCI